MKFELICHCLRGRGGISQGVELDTPSHPCPYAVMIQDIRKISCDCCPACTVLCLPLKVIRDRDKISQRRGPEIPGLYRHCHFLD